MSEIVESTENEVSTPAPEVTSAPAAGSPAPEGDVTPSGEGTSPAFVPNYKFKVLDKEHEIPEFLRSAMKDGASEKQLRELHEKAFGLDIVKPRYQETKKKLDEVQGKFEQQSQGIARLGGYLQKNDFASFIKELNIPEDLILRYALERVQYREMPLEQRLQVDAQMQERERLNQLETQSQTFEQRYYAEATQNRALQLDQGLAKPEVKTIADAFDARAGKPGAFRSEVINRGMLAFHTTGADIPVEQAMNEVLALARGIVPSGGQPVDNVHALPSAQGGQTAPVQPPIIPNVQGRGASPTKRVISSLADLRQRAKEL